LILHIFNVLIPDIQNLNYTLTNIKLLYGIVGKSRNFLPKCFEILPKSLTIQNFLRFDYRTN